MREAWRDDRPVSIIIRVRPGARPGLLRRLEGLGASVRPDFNLVEASSARVRPSLLRRLARDRDVLSISVDAPVYGSDVSSTVTGTAEHQTYGLRAALGLRTTAAPVSAAFQHGAGEYAAGVTAAVNSTAPGVPFGGSSRVKIEDEGESGTQAGMLLRFDRLFGSEPGQIPLGSTITGATLWVSHLGDGSHHATASLHRMLVAWEQGATWSTLSTSGPGVQRDNVEASASADATVTGLASSSAKVFSGPGLVAALQSWAGGAANHGWVIWQDSGHGWTIGTSIHAVTAQRPVLTVTYRAPVEATPQVGTGVTVAVIDSGIAPDANGASRIKTTRDFTTGLVNPPASAPVDEYGHGTHVAGLIGGDRAEAPGVAPGVSFVNLRVLRADGSGSTSNVIRAIEWAIANRHTYGIDVINLSLGHPIFEAAATDPLVQAVEAAVRAGVVVVASAGNIGRNPLTGEVGYAGVTSPGNAPSAITVGATRTFDTVTPTDDLVADYSSRGPTWYDAFVKPDIVAPGHRLLSAAMDGQALYTQLPALQERRGGRLFLRLSGTSMSTGVVSGAVALMVETSRAAHGLAHAPPAIKAMLQHSAIPLAGSGGAGPYDVLTQGVGTLNVPGAVVLAGALDPTLPLDVNWLTAAVPLTTYIDGETVSWGQNIVWGDNLIWGDALFTHLRAWTNEVVWGDTGDNIVWGDSTDNIVWGDSLHDDNIVWGDSASDDNIVWGDSAGDNIVWGDNVNWLDNIVWGDNILWGDSEDNIVWGDTDDNIVWGDTDDNIVWGDSAGEDRDSLPAAVAAPVAAPATPDPGPASIGAPSSRSRRAGIGGRFGAR